MILRNRVDKDGSTSVLPNNGKRCKLMFIDANPSIFVTPKPMGLGKNG